MRQHVLTAGHCLVDNSAGGSTYDKITFYPAISGSNLPFGTLNAKIVRVCSSLPLTYSHALEQLNSVQSKPINMLFGKCGTALCRCSVHIDEIYASVECHTDEVL